LYQANNAPRDTAPRAGRPFFIAPDEGVFDGAAEDDEAEDDEAIPDDVAAWNNPPCTVAGDELDEALFAAEVKASTDSLALPTSSAYFSRPYECHIRWIDHANHSRLAMRHLTTVVPDRISAVDCDGPLLAL
jgi:hypothetical protein